MKLTLEYESKRFRHQYAAHWSFLSSDEAFATAWKSQNLVQAGELAQALLDGNAQTKAEYKVLRVAKQLRE
jgi:hypothetical protein